MTDPARASTGGDPLSLDLADLRAYAHAAVDAAGDDSFLYVGELARDVLALCDALECLQPLAADGPRRPQEPSHEE